MFVFFFIPIMNRKVQHTSPDMKTISVSGANPRLQFQEQETSRRSSDPFLLHRMGVVSAPQVHIDGDGSFEEALYKLSQSMMGRLMVLLEWMGHFILKMQNRSSMSFVRRGMA